MKEDESNWFAKLEEQLPSPEELIPLSQSLISPQLALVFDLHNPNSLTNSHSTPPARPSSSEFENSGDLGSGAGGDEQARTLKRPRLVWTPQLHKRFVDAVAHLGIKNAVPKTIMQLMSVDGLTRENVASHLQKYRLYLKRMQGHSNGGGGGGGLGSSDPATDHLFANSHVPPHFLQHPGGRAGQDHFLQPFVAPTHTGRPIWVTHPQLQQQRHFGSPPNNGQFEQSYIVRQSHHPAHRMGVPTTSYIENVESGAVANGGRKVLTLFPTGDD